MTRTSTAPAPAVHKVTGLPIKPVAVLSVGDLVTEHVGSDGYPGVVVKTTANAVWVRRVRFVLGNVTEQSHANYLDDTTLVIDPESIEQALALGDSKIDGQSGAHKYVLRIPARAAGAPGSGEYPSQRERDEVGADAFHRARWAAPGGYGGLSVGARYRQDPHV